MRLDSVPAIYRKEMLDTLRDRRTLLSMVALPLVAIPLLFVVGSKFMSIAEKKAGEEAVTVAVRNLDVVPGLFNALAGWKFQIKVKDDVKAAVEAKEVAMGVEPVLLPDGRKEIRIYVDLTRPASDIAAGKVSAALETFRKNSVKFELLRRGVPEAVMEPFAVNRINIAPKQRMAGFFLGSMMGYFVILLMFAAGMYPAIDMTAGEKERRTLEVYLSSPASRGQIILGKLLAATTAVFVTALLSMLSLVVSVRYASFGKSMKGLADLAAKMPLDAGTISLVLLALLPTAVLAASLMIAIALFAKSFKEAQSYLTPLMMAAIFPLLAGMVPGLQLTPALALIPLFNVCQLIKEIFLGDYSTAAFAVTMGANILYAALAFAAAVRVFNNEKVLFRT